jgi:hypothetical protein
MARTKKTGSLSEQVDTKYPGYVSEVAGLSVTQLEKRIADMQKTLEDAAIFKEEKNGEAIKSLREQLKDLNADYSDVKKAVVLKTKFCVTLIREKGGQ